MNGLAVEHRLKGRAISEDLAKDLYTRSLQGNVAIVTDNPIVMLSLVRKQWLKPEWHLRRERSSTLNADKILELTNQIARMQVIRFTAKSPRDEPMCDVQFATVRDFLVWPPEANCRTLYVTSPITNEQLYLITSWMRESALAVVYSPCEYLPKHYCP